MESPYVELRERLAAERIGAGGRAVCEALTSVMDAWLAGLAAGVDGIAVVAVGGYGRGELCLRSDIDVMLLHGGRLPADAVQRTLYPLWDANLAVGHSVRTVKEALGAARDDPVTLAALLDSRLVAGEQAPFDEFLRKLGDRLRRGKLDILPALLRAGADRREAEPFPVQDVDVKEGRGGLRALQALHWEARAATLAGGTAPEPDPALEAAGEVLLATRNALHATAGRAENRFVFGLRPGAARWLGLDVVEAARRLYLAVREVDRAASAPPPADDGAGLVDLARRGAAGWEAFEARRVAGWVDRELPEWRHVVAAPQQVPFHAHPVDAHLWRAAAELESITRPGSDETWANEVAADLGRIDEALLAALLHDIGKGRGGDHSVEGEALARSACLRLGLAPEPADRIARAVRLHLLLPDTATRRNLDDPVVVSQVADAVGDLDLLRLLFLLAVADARATGPGMWTEWKAALVRTLFARTAAELARRDTETGPTTDRSRRLAELEVAALPRFDRALVRAHLRGMPAEYADAFGVAQLLDHLALLADPPAAGEVRLAAEPHGPFWGVTVVGRDRPGLLAAVAGVFTLHNVSVLDARLFTRSDGLVLDTFRVEDALGRGIAADWDRMAGDVGAALAGDLDLDGSVAAKARAYRRRGPAAPVRVEHHRDASGVDTVLEVHCGDEVGRLYRIGHALHELSLDVRLAKIDTRGGEVVDVFYVRRPDGKPVQDPAELDRTVATLAGLLAAPWPEPSRPG